MSDPLSDLSESVGLSPDISHLHWDWELLKLQRKGHHVKAGWVLLREEVMSGYAVSKKTLPLGCRSGLGYREKWGKTQCSVG